MAAVQSIAPEVNYNTALEINTATSSAQETWANMGVFAKNITQAFNEVVVQSNYYADEGWGSSEVTGGQLTVTITGDKKVGDPACDFIFDKNRQFAFGDARKTKIRVRRGNDAIVWNVTLANITDTMGDANQHNAVSVTIHGNGKPEFKTITE